MRPGVAERLGVGPDACQARNPALVYGRMTGWGQDGPLASAVGHDIDYIAVSGTLWAIGRARRAPACRRSTSSATSAAAGCCSPSACTAALLEARTSGAGQVVDAAMTDGSASLMTMAHSFFAAGCRARHAARTCSTPARTSTRSTRPRDGRFVAVGAIEPRFYAALLDRARARSPRTLPAQMDRSSWPAMKERFAAVFARRTRDEWTAHFEGTEACVAPVLSPLEAPDHPHNVARGTFVEVAGVAPARPRTEVLADTRARSRPPPEQPGRSTTAAALALGRRRSKDRRRCSRTARSAADSRPVVGVARLGGAGDRQPGTPRHGSRPGETLSPTRRVATGRRWAHRAGHRRDAIVAARPDGGGCASIAQWDSSVPTESLAHVPPVAQVAPVDVELDLVEHPAQVRRVGGLALGRRSGSSARRRDGSVRARRRRRRRTPTTSLRHDTSLPDARTVADYARAMDATRPRCSSRRSRHVTEDGDHERYTHIVLEGFHVSDDGVRPDRQLRGRGDGQLDARRRAVREDVGAGTRPDAVPRLPDVQGDRRSRSAGRCPRSVRRYCDGGAEDLDVTADRVRRDANDRRHRSDPPRSPSRSISLLRSPDIERASTSTPRPVGMPTATSPLTVATRTVPDQARRTVTSPEVDLTDAPVAGVSDRHVAADRRHVDVVIRRRDRHVAGDEREGGVVVQPLDRDVAAHGPDLDRATDLVHARRRRSRS